MPLANNIRAHFEEAARLEAECRNAGLCQAFTQSLGFMLGQLSRAVGRERAIRFATMAIPSDDPGVLAAHEAVINMAHPDHAELLEIVTAASEGARKT